jgi:NADH-quinone oxidoreductase subunit K
MGPQIIPLEHFLILSAILFCIGLVTVVTKKNAIVVLLGVELILNAANINLVAFSQFDPFQLQGQMFSIFVIVVAAAEAAVALALVLKVYSFYKTSNLNEVDKLGD